MFNLKSAALGAAFLGTAATMTLTTGVAQAASISGAITFDGGAEVTPNAGDLSTATGIEFMNPINVESCTGTFASAGLACDGSDTDAAMFTDFSFNPLAPAPVSPLWTADIFSFDLESVTVEVQTSMFLALSGTGIVKGVGYDDTPGIWTFTMQEPDAGGVFTFSAGTEAVPEPLTILGAGAAVAFGGAFKRKLGKKDKKGSTKA